MRKLAVGRNRLVVQLADLGDLLQAAGAITALRRSDPTGSLTLLVKPSVASLAAKLADHVIVADKNLFDRVADLVDPKVSATAVRLVRQIRREHFDEIILLHHLVTGFGVAKFALLTLATGIPIRRGLDDGRGRFLNATIPDRGFGAQPEWAYWSELLGGVAEWRPSADPPAGIPEIPQAYAILHPGSGEFSVARRWPAERFGLLADHLQSELGLDSIVVGSDAEASLTARVARGRSAYVRDMAGRTDLDQLSRLLSGARLFVGNDGGVAQLSGLVGTPTVVIYGPTSSDTWLPAGPLVRSVQLDLPCSPCLYRFHELGTPEGCETRECLVDLKIELVTAAVSDLLHEAKPPVPTP